MQGTGTYVFNKSNYRPGLRNNIREVGRIHKWMVRALSNSKMVKP